MTLALSAVFSVSRVSTLVDNSLIELIIFQNNSSVTTVLTPLSFVVTQLGATVSNSCAMIPICVSVFPWPINTWFTLSASGNSKNLIEAINYCKNKGIETFSITAFDGGVIKKTSDFNLHIPTAPKEYGPAEDVHMMLAGMIGSYLNRYVSFEK